MKTVAHGQEKNTPQQKNPAMTTVVAMLGALTAALSLVRSLVDLMKR